MAIGASTNNDGTVSVEEYLRGCVVGFEIKDEVITSILIDRDIAISVDVLTLSTREKDLCRADLYRRIAYSSPTTTGAVEDADGSWKHKEGGSQYLPADKRRLLSEANKIYQRYGEYDKVVRFRTRIVPHGMRIWKKNGKI